MDTAWPQPHTQSRNLRLGQHVLASGLDGSCGTFDSQPDERLLRAREDSDVRSTEQWLRRQQIQRLQGQAQASAIVQLDQSD